MASDPPGELYGANRKGGPIIEIRVSQLSGLGELTYYFTPRGQTFVLVPHRGARRLQTERAGLDP